MPNIRVEKLTAKEALKIIGISGLVVSSLIVPNAAIAYGAIAKEWHKYKKGDIGRIVRRFQKQKLLKFSEENGQTVIELSKDGKNKHLRYYFDDLKLKKQRDGKLRMVIFDIPNTKRLARDIFRQKLMELGFVKVQESAFITSNKCKDELEFIVNYLNLVNHVSLFAVGNFELGPDFKFKSVYK